MSDERLRPEPLPLDPDAPGAGAPRRRPSRPAVVGAVIAGLLLVCCVSTALFGGAAISLLNLALISAAPAGFWPGHGDAYWADGGHYVVMQGTTEGTPTVAIFDPKTRALRTFERYRVVAVEPGAPRAWVVPDDGRTVRLRDVVTNPTAIPTQSPDQAFDAIDEPTSTLKVLDLDKETPPHAPEAPQGAIEWSPWRGPGGRTMIATVDPSVGCLPWYLYFAPSDDLDHPLKADDPPGASTVLPLGWSPSGRFFAAATAQNDPGLGSGDETVLAPEYAYVWDARTGHIVLQHELGIVSRSEDMRTRVMWDAKADALYCLVNTPARAATGHSAASPTDAGARGVLQKVWMLEQASWGRPEVREVPAPWAGDLGGDEATAAASWGIGGTRFVGSDVDGAYLVAGLGKQPGLWRLSLGNPERVSDWPAGATWTALAPDGRVIVMENGGFYLASRAAAPGHDAGSRIWKSTFGDEEPLDPGSQD
jgi:hypothetical protein